MTVPSSCQRRRLPPRPAVADGGNTGAGVTFG